MGVRLAKTSADAAFIATYRATASRVRLTCHELGRPTRAQIGQVEEVAAVERLMSEGVIVGEAGNVSLDTAARSLYCSGPGCTDTVLTTFWRASHISRQFTLAKVPDCSLEP